LNCQGKHSDERAADARFNDTCGNRRRHGRRAADDLLTSLDARKHR
jgi:hypothetical protein